MCSEQTNNGFDTLRLSVAPPEQKPSFLQTFPELELADAVS
jgi:hypothetical protein